MTVVPSRTSFVCPSDFPGSYSTSLPGKLPNFSTSIRFFMLNVGITYSEIFTPPISWDEATLRFATSSSNAFNPTSSATRPGSIVKTRRSPSLEPVTMSPLERQATHQIDWAGRVIVWTFLPPFQYRTVRSSLDVTKQLSPPILLTQTLGIQGVSCGFVGGF